MSRKPSGLWTPDGEEIEVEHWNQVLVRVVEWLIENGRLSEKEIKKDEMLGYWLPRTRRSLKRPEKLSNGRFVETGLSSQQVLSRAGVFIESSGDPGEVLRPSVWVASGNPLPSNEHRDTGNPDLAGCGRMGLVGST